METASAAEWSYSPWFVQDYGKFDFAALTDSKGTWSCGVNDANTYDAAAKTIVFNTFHGELAFAPKEPSNTLRPVAVNVNMKFTDVATPEMLFDADADSQASLVLCNEGDRLVFIGWTSSGWTSLTNSSLTPATNVSYAVQVEIDYAHNPALVRYGIDGEPLADEGGNTWLNARIGSKTQLSKICFAGKGEVGTFSGEHYPMTAFQFDSVRAVPDEPASFAVTTNAVPRGNVTYSWHLGGQNKNWSATAFSTSSAPVFGSAQCGNWVRVVARDEDGELGAKEFYFSRLPVAYLTTEGEKTPSPAKEDHNGTMFMQGNGRYPDQYDGAMKIHVRGNSTKGLPKKPWKIKLDKKTDMFGLGKNKHWVFLANYLDVGMMRNTVAYDLSGVLGLVHMDTTWVDVVLNGKFQGTYQFCEHIRVGDGRVEVYSWEDAAESVAGKFADANGLTSDQEDELIDQLQQDFSWVTSDSVTFNGITAKPSKLWKKFTNDISGGYLFELSNEYDEASKFMITTNGLSLKTMLNVPEFLCSNTQMMDVCKNIWNDLVLAWTSPDGLTPDGRSWLDLCDVDSMAAYWLTMEITGNNDAVYKSRYAWKEQGKPLVFGPAWDFDWGCASPVVGGTNTTVTGWRIVKSSNEANFYREWGDDPYFALVLWEKYAGVRGYLTRLLEDDGIYDQSLEYIWESGMVDSAMWYNATDNRKGYTFDVDSLWFKRYLKERVAWIDTQFASVETLMNSIKTSNSHSAYSRCATEKLNPVFAKSAPNGRSRETDVLDVRVPMSPFVRVTLTSTSTAMRTLAVRVNGRVVETIPVSPIASGQTGTFSFDLPAEAFFDAGRRNMVDFIAYRGTGEVVYRTWALVTRVRGTMMVVR